MRLIDTILNRLTMYYLVLRYLMILVAVAAVLAFFGLVPYSPWAILFSAFFMMVLCWALNELFARLYKAPTNVESAYITGLILVLIISPALPTDFKGLAFLGLSCVVAIASKFVLSINNKHIFNPAAFGAAFSYFALGGAASWWVGGNIYLLPFVLVGGLLVVRKIQRFDLVLTFLAVALASIAFTNLSNIAQIWQDVLLHSPIYFLATIMLTEPTSTPPTRTLRMVYGALVGLLYTPALHIGSLYSTPELSLVVGNLFSYAVSPKGKLMLTLKRVEATSPTTSDFVFESDRPAKFLPGQYAEWTLPHQKPDKRGNRRYFTLASSPSEREVRLGIKFYDPPSSFKRALAQLKPGTVVSAGQIAGDFVLPLDPTQKIVMIAGGIGVTPFRSMLKSLIDKGEKRDIILLYGARSEQDIIYRELIEASQKSFGLKAAYAVGAVMDAEFVKREVPDFAQRTFYISGPRSMVEGFEDALSALGVPRWHIKTDFFPGFA